MAGTDRRGHALEGPIVISTAGEALLRRAAALAARAVALGDAPYGSLLAGPDGEARAPIVDYYRL